MKTQQRRVAWISLYTPVPMGQQTYERAIQGAMREVADPSWTFVTRSVGGGRSKADFRVPARLSNRRPVAKLVGRLAARGSDLVHRFDLRVPRPPGAHVLTLHDLPPLRFPDEGHLPPWCLDPIPDVEVICPSEFAASEVSHFLSPRHITVIPYGLRDSFNRPEPAPAADLAQLGITGPFFIHAAGATLRKNLEGLAEAWKRAAPDLPDHQLVLLGPPHERRTALFAGLNRVVMPGRLDLDDVGRVMAAADAVVVPSIYEGFGLPALEGMAAGAPVIAARRGALPEVCEAAAVLVEPDGGDIAQALIAVGRGEVDRTDLVDRGLQRAAEFSWAKAARAHLDVYRRVQ